MIVSILHRCDTVGCQFCVLVLRFYVNHFEKYQWCCWMNVLWFSFQISRKYFKEIIKRKNNSWSVDLPWAIDLVVLGSLQKDWARNWKREKESALLSHSIGSLPASGRGRCAIDAECQGSRSVWDSATSILTSSMYVIDGPIKQSLHVDQGRCPGLSSIWSKTELGPSWRSKAVRWLAQLRTSPPPDSLLWWNFLGTGMHVDGDTYIKSGSR